MSSGVDADKITGGWNIESALLVCMKIANHWNRKMHGLFQFDMRKVIR